MNRALAICLLLGLTACDERAKPRREELVVRPAGDDHPRARALARLAAIDRGAELIAVGEGSFVYGTKDPPGEGFEGRPSWSGVRWARASGTVELADRAIDAAIAGDAALVLEKNGDLVLVRGERTVIDREVSPGLALDGRRVAYAKGTPPEFDVVVAEIDGARVAAHPVAPSPAADYLPFFSGGEVAFTSTRAGFPAIWLGAEPKQITGRGVDPRDPAALAAVRAPDGRTPPAASGELIAFFDGSGVTVVKSSGATVGRVDGAREPMWRGRELYLDTPGGPRVATVEEK